MSEQNGSQGIRRAQVLILASIGLLFLVAIVLLVLSDGKGASPGVASQRTAIVEGSGTAPTRTPLPTATVTSPAQPDASPLSLPLLENSLLSAETVGQLEEQLRLGRGTLNGLALRPDGQLLAVASSLGVWLYEATTWDPLILLEGPSKPVQDVAWSPHGDRIAAAAGDGAVWVWHIPASMANLAQQGGWANAEQVLQGGSAALTCVAWSPDGARLASGGWDKSVRVWQTETGRQQVALAGDAEAVMDVAWAPEGEHLASAGRDGHVRLWWLPTEESGPLEVASLEAGSQAVKVVAWSLDGQHLAAAGEDRAIRVWALPAEGLPSSEAQVEMSNVTVLEEQRAFIEALAWSPAGDQLASAALDGTIRLWDMAAAFEPGQTATAPRLVLQAHTKPARDVLWWPDAATLLSAGDDGAVRVWDPVDGKQLDQLTGHADTVLSVSWSPDGSRLAAGVDDNTIRVWSLPSREDAAAGGQAGPGAGTSPRVLKGHRGEVNVVTWSPDGEYLASGGGVLDGRVFLWAAPDFGTARVLSGHSGAVSSLAWSPDGARLVSASWDTTLRIWDQEGRPLRLLNEPASWVLSVAWSPDGSRVAAGERDGGLRVWDAVDGNLVAVLRGHTDQVHAVTWSPDGTQLLSASWDGTLRLWDVAASREVETLNAPGAPTSVAWSPDGRFWAVAAAFHDDRVHILDAGTGREVATLAGHTDYVTMVAWSPDGARLATASADGTVRVWGLPETP